VALEVSGDRGDEARTLARLDHPHIVRVFDQRRLEGTAGRPRLVSEQFLPGGTHQKPDLSPARPRAGDDGASPGTPRPTQAWL
jgi:hypothetical protein